MCVRLIFLLFVSNEPKYVCLQFVSVAVAVARLLLCAFFPRLQLCNSNYGCDIMMSVALSLSLSLSRMSSGACVRLFIKTATAFNIHTHSTIAIVA